VIAEQGNLAYTLPRLLGLHNLSGARLARLLGVTTQYVWMLMNGARYPTDERLLEIAGLFGIEPDRLANASFEELLQIELADPVRYRETEERVAHLESSRASASRAG
jgi:transcriptional regulator with XRE-family HTH domain